MKSLTLFANELIQLIGDSCGIDTTRDRKTATDRIENEGISFLTITLPAFCKDFERSLANEQVSPSAFPGFSRSKDVGFPRFLGGFLERIFDSSGELQGYPLVEDEEHGYKGGEFISLDPNSRTIYHHKSAELFLESQWQAIRGIRQICLMYSKIELEASEKRERDTIKGYLSLEEEIADAVVSDSHWESFSVESLLSFADRLSQRQIARSTITRYDRSTALEQPLTGYMEIPNGFSVRTPNGSTLYFLMRNTAAPIGWTVFSV